MNGWDSGFGWKENWAETRQHFCDWWNRDGLVVSTWGAFAKARVPHAAAEWPPHPARDDHQGRHEDCEWLARCEFKRLAEADFGLDILPTAGCDIGPGSLAFAIGGEPGFSPETVRFKPVWKDVADPRGLPPIRFNPDARWWRVH
jgi:hypothetical protein